MYPSTRAAVPLAAHYRVTAPPQEVDKSIILGIPSEASRRQHYWQVAIALNIVPAALRQMLHERHHFDLDAATRLVQQCYGHFDPRGE